MLSIQWPDIGRRSLLAGSASLAAAAAFPRGGHSGPLVPLKDFALTLTRDRERRDTVLLPPRETTDIASVADNPGDWTFHCHILDHQDGGMAVIRAT